MSRSDILSSRREVSSGLGVRMVAPGILRISLLAIAGEV
jgi:hypothetical protein